MWRAVVTVAAVALASAAALALWPRPEHRQASVRLSRPSVAAVPFGRFAPADVSAFASATPGGSLIERQQLVVFTPVLPVVLPNGTTPVSFGAAASAIASSVPGGATLTTCGQTVLGLCPAAVYLLAAAAVDADGNLLPRAVVAARVAALLRQMRADALGWRVREAVRLVGLAGQDALVRWRLLDAASGRSVLGAWLTADTAYRVSASGDDDRTTLSVWIPLPRRKRPLVLRFDAYLPPGSASVASTCVQIPAGAGAQPGFARTSCTSRRRRSRNPASQ